MTYRRRCLLYVSLRVKRREENNYLVSREGTWVVPVKAVAPVPVAVSRGGTCVDVATARPLRKEIVKIENNIFDKVTVYFCFRKRDIFEMEEGSFAQ